jgi:hypothetical protein
MQNCQLASHPLISSKGIVEIMENLHRIARNSHKLPPQLQVQNREWAMVVVHIVAGTLGMLIGVWLFSGHDLVWMILLSILSGSAAIMISGLAIVVRSHRLGDRRSQPESSHSLSNAE